MRKFINVALVASAAVVATTCGSDEPEWSDDPCAPDYVGIPGIGPAGGTWENTSVVDGAIQGLRVTVPPGKWSACWQLEVEWSDSWNTPDYPAGFVPVAGPWAPASISITIYRQPAGTHYSERTYAPDSMYVELSFPLHSIPADSQRFLAAFNYDSTAMDWRLQSPDKIDTSFLTIHTSSWRREWSFGRIDPARIDFERYVAPALAARVGTGTLSQIQRAIDSIYNTVPPMDWPPDCNDLDVMKLVFESFRDNGIAAMNAIQAGIHCGTCDALTQAFWDDWETYLQMQDTQSLLKFFTGLIIPEESWLQHRRNRSL
jgi:hypothetical protein